MLNLQRVAMFIAVVDTGSFTAAAATLGQTKAVLSFNIRQLEDSLGVALLRDAENLQDEVQANHIGLSGELRITTTPEYGTQVVIPALAAFSERHPALRIRHVSSSHHADLISERFDVAIRLGTLADSRYHAALISRFDILPVAAPQWLSQHSITTLHALAHAPWIIHQRLSSPLRWQVTDAAGSGERLEIKQPARIFADSAQALMSFALAGCGVALLPAWLVQNALAEGRLVHLLPEWRFAPQGVYAVYADTQHLSAKVRALVDFLRQWVAQEGTAG